MAASYPSRSKHCTIRVQSPERPCTYFTPWMLTVRGLQALPPRHPEEDSLLSCMAGAAHMSGMLVPLAPRMTKAKMSCHNWDPLALVPGVTPPPESLNVSKDLVQHCPWQPEPFANTSRAEATNMGTTPQQKTLKVLVRTRTPTLTEKDLERQCESCIPGQA